MAPEGTDNNSKPDEALKSAREDIDRIDREFVKLLAERMDVVRRVGSAKREDPEAPLRDLERERHIFEFWARQAEDQGISGYFAGRVLREILNYSRRHQERLLDTDVPANNEVRTVRVGYQGIEGAYSDLAISKLFSTRSCATLDRCGFRSFTDAVDALQSGEIEYALLPIENTVAGSINEVYKLLAEREILVVDEEVWAVEHCLVGLPGATADRIRVVRSHPVALQQCERFLDGLVGTKSESWFDTAAAARSVAEATDDTLAAICSEEAAENHGLVVLRRGIADQADNMTRFVLVGLESEPVDERIPGKTSLIFTVAHRRGALASCLQAFASQDVNLSKLESRPLPHAPWEYLFYVDIDGWITEERVVTALDEIRSHTNHLKVLGSYPRRIDVGEEAVPGTSSLDPAPMAAMPPASIPPPVENLKLSGLRESSERTVVRVGRIELGGDGFVLLAGPCAVENRSQIMDAAAMVKKHGASILRGGAFKPRSSPYSFQGLGFDGLDLLAEAGAAYEMPIVTEVLRAEDVDRVAMKADMLQVGARNMQNFELLKKLGTVNRPILLKRGMSATIDELLLAAEYIMAGGNRRVVLCERGIRTFETSTRNTLDVSAVPVLRSRTHLPVIVDPSHAAGRRDLVIPLSLAAVAAGAAGVIVEAHPRPEEALCDKEQALHLEDLEALHSGIRSILAAQGREMS